MYSGRWEINPVKIQEPITSINILGLQWSEECQGIPHKIKNKLLHFAHVSMKKKGPQMPDSSNEHLRLIPASYHSWGNKRIPGSHCYLELTSNNLTINRTDCRPLNPNVSLTHFPLPGSQKVIPPPHNTGGGESDDFLKKSVQVNTLQGSLSEPWKGCVHIKGPGF